MSERRGLIGLSVSQCIREILEGKVDEQDVLLIVGGTKCTEPAHWANVKLGYSTSAWYADPERGCAILDRFVDQGKIYQPRVTDGVVPCHGNEIWVTSPDIHIIRTL